MIASGNHAKNPKGAVDAWMATFHHRLPLLRPGLVRIGWGATTGASVLDVLSLVQPDYRYYHILWPPDGMKGVPLRFEPELPHPVPGVNPSTLGYPITVQRHVPGGETSLELRLYEGSDVNPSHEVPCYYSTPSKPSNPELKPEGAYCLIPKSPLKSFNRYTVCAKDLFSDKRFTWCFTTRK